MNPPIRLLVIDDDIVMRELLVALLSAEGYVAENAESGEAALAMLQAGVPPDAIVTDVQLPGLQGAELAAKLRVTAPHTRIAGMSGSDPGPEARAVFDSFLLKPFSVDKLIEGLGLGQTPASIGSPAAHAHSHALDETIYNQLATSLPAGQLAELYRLTMEDAAARLELLAAALRNNDLAAFRREAHSLKGGCSMVGASEIASIAAEAELAPTDTVAGTTLESLSPALVHLRGILSARFMHYK